jgi:hypothetical protein
MASVANSWRNFLASPAEKSSSLEKIRPPAKFDFLKARENFDILLSVSTCLGKLYSNISLICTEFERIKGENLILRSSTPFRPFFLQNRP